MTDRDDREQQKAELLWRYIEELKRAENPEEVQFVAVTRGECAEVVGLMETAAEAYVLTRSESAPHCRREAVRQRLQSALGGAIPAARSADPAPTASPRPSPLPAWLTAPLTGRSTGWAVAVAALLALLWFRVPRVERTPRIIPMEHAAAVAAIPKLINGTLDAEQSRALLAHLVECDGCMERYLRLKATRPVTRPLRQSRLPRENPAVERRQWLRRGSGVAGYPRVASVAWGR
jgi:hypothetical protein